VYHIRGWGKFNRHYGDFCTGADKITIIDLATLLGRLLIFAAISKAEG
jgi:hypothetical protein